MESYLGDKRSTEAWRILKNLRKTENEGHCFNPIYIGKLETNFKRLLTENRERYLREQEIELGFNDVGMDKMNLDIETLKTTIKFLKNNTSCEFGGVPAELLKSGTERLYNLLRQIFKPCLNGDESPNDWKIGHISVIHKKGKKDECQNYRGVRVLNILADYTEKF